MFTSGVGGKTLICGQEAAECNENTLSAVGPVLELLADFRGSFKGRVDWDKNKSSSRNSGALESGELWSVHELPRVNWSLSEEDWKDSSSIKGSLRKLVVCSESSEQLMQIKTNISNYILRISPKRFCHVKKAQGQFLLNLTRVLSIYILQIYKENPPQN